jgi:hypothetical protein
MKIYQSRSFEKKAKKMTKFEKDSLDRQIKRIAEDPNIGEEKKGDPRGRIRTQVQSPDSPVPARPSKDR